MVAGTAEPAANAKPKKAAQDPQAGKPEAIPDGRVAGKAAAGQPEPRGVTQHHYKQPYSVDVTIRGTEIILLHKYDAEQVAAQGKAAKGSREKKTDNVEAMVHRCADGTIGVLGTWLKANLADGAKYFQDPRSPRKSARDLVRAGLRIRGEYSFGVQTWDFIDKRRVMVQRNAVTRSRPALHAGWALTFQINVLDPEYLTPTFLNELLVRTGRSVGFCDFRPDFGTYQIDKFEVVELTD